MNVSGVTPVQAKVRGAGGKSAAGRAKPQPLVNDGEFHPKAEPRARTLPWLAGGVRVRYVIDTPEFALVQPADDAAGKTIYYAATNFGHFSLDAHDWVRQEYGPDRPYLLVWPDGKAFLWHIGSSTHSQTGWREDEKEIRERCNRALPTLLSEVPDFVCAMYHGMPVCGREFSEEEFAAAKRLGLKPKFSAPPSTWSNARWLEMFEAGKVSFAEVPRRAMTRRFCRRAVQSSYQGAWRYILEIPREHLDEALAYAAVEVWWDKLEEMLAEWRRNPTIEHNYAFHLIECALVKRRKRISRPIRH